MNFVGTPTCWALVGKTVRGGSVGTRDRRKYQTGNVCLFFENKDYSYRYTWDDIKNGWKETDEKCGS